MTLNKTILSLAVLLLATVPLALAQGTYTQIDYPGSAGTYVQGINALGEVSGTYLDGGGNEHGFLLNAGTYTNVDYPDGGSTWLFGLNDIGQVVGYTLTTGFVYEVTTGSFKNVNVPQTSGTVPTAINNSKAIVGYYGSNDGFESTNGAYVHIGLPAFATFVEGITSSGVTVGQLVNSKSQSFNFILSKGKYSLVTIPNATGALVYGVNPSGTTLVGSYGASFLSDSGFVYKGRVLQQLQFPGAMTTFAYSVNDAGEVAGSFYDAAFVSHGFTWTPPAAKQN